MRNYDTTTHKPYPRVTRIVIEYPESGIPVVTYDEHTAIVDGDNRVQMLAATGQQHVLLIDPAKFAEPIQIVHPSTGADIPGQSITLQQIMLGVTAVVRADQLRRDAEADAVAATAASPVVAG